MVLGRRLGAVSLRGHFAAAAKPGTDGQLAAAPAVFIPVALLGSEVQFSGDTITENNRHGIDERQLAHGNLTARNASIVNNENDLTVKDVYDKVGSELDGRCCTGWSRHRCCIGSECAIGCDAQCHSTQ